ncbi:MAG: hypothetical protein WDN06_05345 [Asticcacaulis sp.]
MAQHGALDADAGLSGDRDVRGLAVGVRLQADCDSAPPGPVNLCAVVHQVADRLDEAGGIAVDPDGFGGDIDVQDHAAGGDEIAVVLDGLAGRWR